MDSERITLRSDDGHRFGAYVARPDGAARGAVVVIQEIFGVNAHIRSVADRYAAAGYLAVAPQMFDRAQRDFERGYSGPEIEEGRQLMQGLKWDETLRDVDAAVAHATTAGKVAIVGFCWGGTVAWRAAAKTAGLACSVPYYGGGIHGFIDEEPRVPVMFHFAEQDKSPTLEQAREIAARHPRAMAHFYPAGHGFNCDQRGSYDAASAKLANERTLDFLRVHLQVAEKN